MTNHGGVNLKIIQYQIQLVMSTGNCSVKFSILCRTLDRRLQIIKIKKNILHFMMFKIRQSNGNRIKKGRKIWVKRVRAMRISTQDPLTNVDSRNAVLPMWGGGNHQFYVMCFGLLWNFIPPRPPSHTTQHHNAQIQSLKGLSIYFEASNASCSFGTIPLYLLTQVSCVTLYYMTVLDGGTYVVKFLSLWCNGS